MTLTVWGDCGGPNGQSAHYNRYGQLTEAHSYRELDLELPTDGIEIDLDHNGERAGELVHAELGTNDRLRAVAVLDSDWLTNVEQPVFFSPLVEMIGNVDGTAYVANRARLLGLSLTFDTARLGGFAVEWRPGDVRESIDRFKWPHSWSSDGLLERAAGSKPGQSPLRIRARSLDFDLPQLTPQQIREVARAQQLPGGLRKSGHRGRVISVR